MNPVPRHRVFWYANFYPLLGTGQNLAEAQLLREAMLVCAGCAHNAGDLRLLLDVTGLRPDPRVIPAHDQFDDQYAHHRTAGACSRTRASGVCPVCHSDQTLRADGAVTTHPTAQSGPGDQQPCPGTGKLPADAPGPRRWAAP